MTFTLDMTVLAIAALIAGVAGFFAPRFLGIAAAAALCVFAVFQLFPDVRNEIESALNAIDLDGTRVEEPASPAPGRDAG